MPFDIILIDVEWLSARLYISTLEGNLYCGKVNEDRSGWKDKFTASRFSNSNMAVM